MNDNITEINKDTFWALIQEAKDACGQDNDAWAKYMIDRLAGLGPEQSLMFLNYMDAYKDLAFRYGLWDAAKIFRVDGCSDDSFSYFRSWLIVQGKDVYMAALADPDSLADVEPYADCFFETAGYVGAYRHLLCDVLYHRYAGLHPYLCSYHSTCTGNIGRHPVHAVPDKDRKIWCSNYYGYAGQRPLLSDGTKLDFYSVWNRIRFSC